MLKKMIFQIVLHLHLVKLPDFNNELETCLKFNSVGPLVLLVSCIISIKVYDKLGCVSMYSWVALLCEPEYSMVWMGFWVLNVSVMSSNNIRKNMWNCWTAASQSDCRDFCEWITIQINATDIIILRNWHYNSKQMTLQFYATDFTILCSWHNTML